MNTGRQKTCDRSSPFRLIKIHFAVFMRLSSMILEPSDQRVRDSIDVAELLDPLYRVMKKELLSSKVIGTDDTRVKVLDRNLPVARNRGIGRIWPYVGDAHHPVIVYDYTPTRSRAGPAKFLEGYKGYLQAAAYSVYDAFSRPAFAAGRNLSPRPLRTCSV
jgi:hypothetical protein